MVKIKGLKIAYKGVQVVHGINFDIIDHKITVMVGANGAGKTSIIKSLMGILRPTGGEIWYNDTDLLKVPPYMMASLGISLCPEGRQLFPSMTVRENLELGAYSRKDKKQIKLDIDETLQQFPVFANRQKQKAKTLSGGEQELLAIARALMAKPKLLILDEPSWGLAPLMVEEVMRIVKGLNRDSQMTIFLVEQNVNVALRYADYAYVLDVGVIAIQGTGRELLKNDKVREVYLGV